MSQTRFRWPAGRSHDVIAFFNSASFFVTWNRIERSENKTFSAVDIG